MTIYLCTCGTSAGKKLPERLTTDWVKSQGGVESASEKIFNSFCHASMDDKQALRQILSAEIHSLSRMGVTGADQVVLFSSETLDGEACTKAVARYLERQIPDLVCSVEVVGGLQVHDAQRFRSQGVLNFVKKALAWIDNYGADQCVLNPTGGFKSLVPYTVLIGMIKGVSARYIFEQSSELIELPNMPVDFTRERIEPFRELLERIDRETYIPLIDWENNIPFGQRRELESLIEIDGKQLTFSPVGFLLWEEIRKPSSLIPYLSRPAIEDFEQLSGKEGCKPLEFLQRVLRSREQLQAAKHDAMAGGLFWLKPGQHTRDRYLVSEEGWRLLVWRMVDHDEYERLLQENRQSNLGAKLLQDRRSRYEPFFRMELYRSE
jgi:putative CRISPR-associated protein (TIGR02619 family)